MASTLPLTDDGDITQNSETPNDGKYKLQNAATGSGNKLTIEGSNAAASSNGNGGDITLVPGTLDGSGANGKVDVEGELYLKTYSKIGSGSGMKNTIQLYDAYSNDAGGMDFTTYYPTTGSFRFFTGGRNTGGTELQQRMMIRHDGKVGIGTTNPGEKIEVDGNIKLTDCYNDRVWATEKVFNVLDFGAVTTIPIIGHEIDGILSNSGGYVKLTDTNKNFSAVTTGDKLWILGGNYRGFHTITARTTSTITTATAFVNAETIGYLVVQGATPSDQTDEFNSAIGAAAAAGGGIVVVPSGYYYFSSNDDIEVQENVTLRGVFSGPPKWNPSSIYNGDLQGTVLLCTRGRDTETPDIDTAFIRFIGPNSAVVGISIYYPEQEIFNDGDAKGISAVEISAASPVDELEFETSSPHTFVAGDVIEIIGIVTTPVEPNTFNGTYIVKEVADSTHFTVINYQNASDTYVSGGSAQKRSFHKYPWTIKGCEQCTIKDILLVNPYLGINLLGAGRHYLDGIFGTPLLTGISVDNCLDVGRIYRVHFHRVFWDGGTTPTGSLFNLLARAVGLELKRTDGQIVNDLFTFGYKTAIKLTAGDYGAGYGLLSNIYIDGSDLGIDIDTLQQNTGYYFSTLYVSVPWALRTDDGDTNWYAMPIINRTNIKINAAISSCVRGPIQIVGGNFTGAVVRHIYWNAPNDDASLGLYGCNLVGYYLFPTNPSLDLEAGHVRVINCKFGQNVITTINKTGEVKLVTFGNRNQIAADTNECLGNMIIQDGGYLGLGTSNPDAKLDVVATCPPSSPTFYGSGYNNGNAFGAYTGSKANAPVSYKVQIETVYEGNITSVADAGDGKVTITSTGHGLSNGNEITITGTTNYDGIFVISNTTTNTFEIEALFTITKSGSWEKTNTFKWSDTNGSTWNETGKAITTQVQALNNGISFCFATKTGHIASDYWYFVADVINPLQLNDNENTSLMIVKNNGNVGVGTSSPNEKIEVYGSSPAIRISGAGANDEPALDFYKAGGRTGRIQSYASNLCLYAGDTGNGDIKFFDKMPATSSLLMIIKAGGSVGIGTTSPDASALLQVDSTTKGFLPPRMTTGQRDAISNPIEGLVIYNTSTHKLQFHNGTNWGDV